MQNSDSAIKKWQAIPIAQDNEGGFKRLIALVIRAAIALPFALGQRQSLGYSADEFPVAEAVQPGLEDAYV